MSTTASITIADNRAVDAPLLVSFPQGVPDSSSNPMNFQVLKKRQAPTYIVKANKNSIKYRGTNFGEHASKKNCHQMAVGVFNPKTNELKLHPCNHAYILRPHVEPSVASSSKPAITNATRRETLTNEFGSKKKRRALQAAKSNTISAENISAATELESNMFIEEKPELRQDAQKIIERSKKRSRG
jgi:DNA repair exonuclease SbcCD nuclease subunit